VLMDIMDFHRNQEILHRSLEPWMIHSLHWGGA
jgi:hypothetical protein